MTSKNEELPHALSTKKILKAAEGMQHNRTRSFRLAKQGVIRALQYAYRDRRNKKRDLRGLWITRINAAARQEGTTYGKLIASMKSKKHLRLNRKNISRNWQLTSQKTFAEIIKASL